MPMIELYEGFYVNVGNEIQVAVVKATGDDTCALFTPGQSAVGEGFLVPYSADQVCQQLNDAEQELFEEADEEEEEEK